MTEDPRRYRVNLICTCRRDIVYGYGADEPAARATAEQEFKAHGGRATYSHIVVERVTDDGTHYETDHVKLHMKFPAGLGGELDARALELGLGNSWAVAFGRDLVRKSNPYLFESADAVCIEALLALLDNIRANAPSGSGGRSTAHCARMKARQIREVLKYL